MFLEFKLTLRIQTYLIISLLPQKTLKKMICGIWVDQPDGMITRALFFRSVVVHICGMYWCIYAVCFPDNFWVRVFPSWKFSFYRVAIFICCHFHGIFKKYYWGIYCFLDVSWVCLFIASENIFNHGKLASCFQVINHWQKSVEYWKCSRRWHNFLEDWVIKNQFHKFWR